MHANRTGIVLLVVVAVTMVLLMVAGCGGGDGTAEPTNVGHVSGRVVDLASGMGVGNMLVTIGGQQDYSDAGASGAFLVRNITPGVHDIIVTPTDLFVPVGEIPPVTVIVGQTTPLPGAILVVDPNYAPPPSP